MAQHQPSWWFRKFIAHGITGASTNSSSSSSKNFLGRNKGGRRRSFEANDDDEQLLVNRENPLGESTNRRTSKEDLGRATWTFLHVLASQYPDEPTEEQKRDAKQLVYSLTRLYPCKECAEHFQDVVAKIPPDVSSSVVFQRWMCEVHNEVNGRLGKEKFYCGRVDERWGGVECLGEDGEDAVGCSFDAAAAARKSKR